MPISIVQRIFRRVQIPPAHGKVLDAILSKANIYGQRAKVAYPALAAMTGFSERHVIRIVKALVCEYRLVRVDKRVLWPGHNRINIYHVVIPWRGDISYQDLGRGRNPPAQYRQNNKGDRPCHPNPYQGEKSLAPPARPCSKEEASAWFKPGSDPWYFAQGLEPPGEAEKKPSGNSN
jgi:hypothetical protein